MPAAAAAACAPAQHPLIAEVLYDAVGDDTGWEFVELYNPYDRALPLAGARLEAGDGSGPGRWTLRWTGNAGTVSPPVDASSWAGAKVQPAPQAVVTLELQNGPDALRLVWPDGAVEVVGYGAHEFAEYSCGAPAPDVAAGAVARPRPGRRRPGEQRADFRAATPSPGRANQPQRDLALLAGSLVARARAAGARRGRAARGAVANRGATAIAAGEATLVRDRVLGGGERAALRRGPLGAALAPGDTAAFDEPRDARGGQVAAAGRGRAAGRRSAGERCRLAARARGAGAARADRDPVPPGARGRASGSRCGTARPRRSTSRSSRSRTAAPRAARPPAGAGALEPESLAVLAQDRAALLAPSPGSMRAGSGRWARGRASTTPTTRRAWPTWWSCARATARPASAWPIRPRGFPRACRSSGATAAGGRTRIRRARRSRPAALPRAARAALRVRAAAAARGRDGAARLGPALAAGPRLARLYDLAGRRVARPLEEFAAPPGASGRGRPERSLPGSTWRWRARGRTGAATGLSSAARCASRGARDEGGADHAARGGRSRSSRSGGSRRAAPGLHLRRSPGPGDFGVRLHRERPAAALRGARARGLVHALVRPARARDARAACGAGWRLVRVAAGFSQTGEPDLGWSAAGLACGWRGPKAALACGRSRAATARSSRAARRPPGSRRARAPRSAAARGSRRRGD